MVILRLKKEPLLWNILYGSAIERYLQEASWEVNIALFTGGNKLQCQQSWAIVETHHKNQSS